MAKVLVIAVDRELAQTVARAMEDHGLGVSLGRDPMTVLEEVRASGPDALIVEMFLGARSGFAVCKTLRETPDTQSMPVILLTGPGSEMDRILAFEAGADDVVTCPFFARELALRVRALVRRAGRSGPETLSGRGSRLEHGPLRADLDRKKFWVERREVRLTAKELRILTLLMTQPGRVFTRDDILAAVWAGEAERTLRVVDTHMKGIRRKLGASGAIIESLRGVGYRLAEPPEEP
jgi:two-component system phosphate regulon response regulator PhoB